MIAPWAMLQYHSGRGSQMTNVARRCLLFFCCVKDCLFHLTAATVACCLAGGASVAPNRKPQAPNPKPLNPKPQTPQAPKPKKAPTPPPPPPKKNKNKKIPDVFQFGRSPRPSQFLPEPRFRGPWVRGLGFRGLGFRGLGL